MLRLEVELTMSEPLLGTLSGNKELVDDFIAGKHPEGVQPDESEAADKAIEKLEETIEEEKVKSSTIFPRTDSGEIFLWDYQIKGFFKDACSMLRRIKGNKNTKLKAHKKVIDGLVFPQPRKILIETPNGSESELSFTERPLRGQTAQGERIALVRSETAPAGSKLHFDILLLEDSLLEYIKSWLHYGVFRGLGQWRNSGMGRFEWKLLSTKKTD